MVNADKKKWSTPKLRVFLRLRTEETLISGCKLSGSTAGPKPQYNKCAKFLYDPCPLYCSDITGS